MGSIWTYKYGNHTITVKNEKATELYVDGELQDQKRGISLKADLKGKLPGGEEIMVTVGGLIDVECMLHVDRVLQVPVEVK